MSIDLKERERTVGIRRESPTRDGRTSRDGKGPPMRDSRPVRDNITNRNDPHSIRCRIFLGNLSTEKMSRDEVGDIFSQYGKVTAISLHAHFGFVQYEDERSADNAVAKENGKMYYGKKLEVNLAGDRRKDSKPPERDGRPPFRDGRPPVRDGRPPERERRPPPPFDRRDREFDRDRERPRRSPPRDRYGEHGRFPPRFEGPPDRVRRSLSPRREGFRPPFGRHDDPYERDRYRDDPYFRETHDRPPLDRRGPPDRRDFPAEDRRDFPPPNRREYPDRHAEDGYGRGRPRSPPPPRGGPPSDRYGDERDRRETYDRPRGPYDERRDDYYKRDDPYAQDYPPVKKPRTDYDLPPEDAYSGSSKLPSVPTDCIVVVMNKQQRGYAEMVERRLKASGLVVDLKYDIAQPMTELLNSVARNGVLYAIVITSQHEVHRSVTVNILHGTPQEHRNMPLEDAMRFVGQNFDRYMQDLRERSKKSSLSSLETGSASSGTAPAPTPSKQGSEISDLLSRAASGETLSSDQLSRLIDNLSKQQKEISGAVGANGGQGGSQATAGQASSQALSDAQSIAKQQAELQAKILSILNPGAKTALANLTGYQTQQSSAQKPAEAATAAKSTIAALYPPAKPTFPAYGAASKASAPTTSTAVAATGQYAKASSGSYGVSSAPAVSAPHHVARSAPQSSPFTVSPKPSSAQKSSASAAYGQAKAYTSPAHSSPAGGLRSTSAAGYPRQASPSLAARGAPPTARTSTPHTLPRTPPTGAAGQASILGAPTGTARTAAPPGTLPRPRLAAPAGTARPPPATGMPAPRGAAPRGGVAPRGAPPPARGGAAGRGASMSARGTGPSRGGVAPHRGGVSSAPYPRGGLASTRGAARGIPVGHGPPHRGGMVPRGTLPPRGVPRGRGLVRPVGRAGVPRGRGLMGPAPRGAPISTIMNRRGR